MNENQHNFDELKRLLKLKRHEVPPPGYFNNFSGEIVARIRQGEASGRLPAMERLQHQASWLANFLRLFETRPGMAGGFAIALCSLLLIGVVITEHADHAAKNLLADSTQPAQPDNTLASLAPAAAPVLAAVSTPADTNPPIASLMPAATMFGEAGGSSLFQPASFAPAR